jgi:RNA polymerase sigma factor (sigma-70 family)
VAPGSGPRGHVCGGHVRGGQNAWGGDLTRGALRALLLLMEWAAVSSVPPFERFYGEHRDAVFAFLRSRLGPAADDAFQETFLRALRGYGALRHGTHLRAWVFTIATNVITDEHRRSGRRPVVADIPDVESVDEPPSYQELEELTAGLPPKERAAVVLRYGYDLDYQQIGNALGSSAEAARQATSSGVRRIRRKEQS